ncbi:RHS repeat-associated core domain-containing protein [Chryseolinea serpens]|uniref:RHS repeat-associated core domain-containing protein n=1 Tax=Chryseolinea serpens TaxID=947013 RepID=A0A1M5MLA5_9BACT|nr:GDSL-type esterase/lipase family protein [Chryseolinea serpens]SHG77987.1 RHS repeat-associated core domain-containing protein [Chryseolinea serpens]
MKFLIPILFLSTAIVLLSAINVKAQPKVYFHAGNANAAPAPWNNALHDPYGGTVFSDLKDDSGNNTGIKIELLTWWGGAYPSGVTTGNGSGIVPDPVLSEYYWFGLGISSDQMRVKISGLMPSTAYTFNFLGASAYHGSGITNNGNTIYTIGARSVSLAVENNTTSLATIPNVVSDAQGEVEVVITRASNAAAGYLNAIIVDLPADVLYTPSGLSSNYSTNALSLQWNDNNSTETGYDIYRANPIAGEDFQLVGTTGANVTSFTDNTVLEGYSYQYKVLAKNLTRASSFSTAYEAVIPVGHGASITIGSHIYFDFGNSNSSSASWNNAGREPSAGLVFNNLLDQSGVNTGVSVELLTAWGGAYTDGATTGNNTGIVPDNVLKDYYWFGLFGAPNVVRFKIRGLSPSSSYNLRFVGSSVFRQAGITNNGHTIYKIGTDAASLDVESNTSQAAEFLAVKANALGEVVVTLEKGSDAAVGYINAMMIDLPTGMMYTPPGLKGIYGEATGVALTWTDNNTSESGYQIYRSNVSTGDPYALIATTAASVVTYTDATVSQNSIYKYKVRAINGSGVSNYSQEITSRTTPVKKVLFSFGKTLDGPSPWNNAHSDPQAGMIFKNLKDEFNIATGLSLELLTGWGGVNTEGATTGNNSGIVPDNVLKEFYWFGFLGAPNEVQFRINGLSPDKLYNFRIVGSSVFRYGNLTDNGSTVYTINGTTVSLNVESNTSAAAEFFDVSPDANGQIVVSATKGVNAFAGYLNAVMIDLPKDMLYVPAGIEAKYVAGAGVNLTWTDNNATETGYQVYRSTVPGTGYSLVYTTAANAGAYSDGTVQDGTLYYYKIRAISATSTSSYSLETIVRASEMKKIALKFGKEFAAPAHWNSTGADPVEGARYNHLKDEFGLDAGISVKLLTAWGGLYRGGPTTGSNSGAVPDDVLQEYYWFGMFGSPEEVRLRVSGLNPLKTYNFKFLGSSIFHVGGTTDNGNTIYQIEDRSASVAVENNTANFAELQEISPDTDGNVEISIRKGAGATAGFINAMILEMEKKQLYAPPLTARYTQGTGVVLQWTDNNTSETGYEIYRSNDGGDSYTLLTTTSGSVSNYTDHGVVHGNTYFYKVRATSGAITSVYSDPFIADCVNKQLVRLKFGRNLSVPAPWNNTARDPASGAIISDLLDDVGQNSGVSVELEGDWGGVYNQGTTTGNDSGVVPDNVLMEYYYFGFLSATTEVKFKVKGLIPSARYNFRLVGSSAFRGGGVTDNGNTVYSIGDESVSLYVEGNTSNYAEFLNAVADSNGEIEVRLSKGQGAAVGYINAMMLEVPSGGLNFWAVANGNWSDAIWNTNKSATIGAHLPAGSSVIIEGKSVFVNTNATAKEIRIAASGELAGSLVVDNAELINSGRLEVSDNGTNFLKVMNQGKLTMAGEPIKIIPIGNSITQGNSTNFSYRYELWKKLVDDDINFDFIGSQSTNNISNPDFPTYKGKTFDTDNEGHWGWRADEIAAGLPAWLSGKKPDIALVHAGTNDMYQGQSVASTGDDLRAIISTLRTANPNVRILLAQIIPMNIPGVNANITLLNDLIKQISVEKNTQVSPIYLVDQNTGFDLNLDLNAVDLIHPTPSGEKKMADQWYKGLLLSLQSLQESTDASENVSHPCGEKQYSTDAISVRHAQFANGCSNALNSADKVILEKDVLVEKGSRLSLTASYVKDLLEYQGNFNGLISSIRWRTETPFGLKENDFTGGYTFVYDQKGQIKDASWADLDLTTSQLVETGDGTRSNKFRVTNLSYDANGNIQALKRFNGQSLPMHDFSYFYDENMKNRLITVNGYVKNYTYDKLGRMTVAQKDETNDGESQYVEYDVSGKVTFIYSDEARTIKKVQYQYDDHGFRVAKIVYQPDIRTTWYIRDLSGSIMSIYEQEGEPTGSDDDKSATLTEIPLYGSGKLGTYYPQQEESVDYELTDHLGNVRALIRDNKASFAATMEDDGETNLENPRVQEMQYFENLFASEQGNVEPGLNHTPQTGSYRPNYAAYLNGEDRIIGPAISLRVQAGDELHLNTFVKFEEQNAFPGPTPLISIISALATTYALTPGIESVAKATDMFTEAYTLAAPFGSNTDAPRAFLNYILFDNEMHYVTAQGIPVSDDAGFEPGQAIRTDFEELVAEITVNQNGYIYVFVSNETPGVNVWFDDLRISIHQNIVKQATDFGVWGDIVRERKSDASEYRFAYQGQSSEKDTETGWNHFEAREFDPAIGRWLVPDPMAQHWSPYLAMGNSGVNKLDPDGNWDGWQTPDTDVKRFWNWASGHSYLNRAYDYIKNPLKNHVITSVAYVPGAVIVTSDVLNDEGKVLETGVNFTIGGDMEGYYQGAFDMFFDRRDEMGIPTEDTHGQKWAGMGGWIGKKLYSSAKLAKNIVLRERFVQALKKGMVGPYAEEGIKTLTGKGINIEGAVYKFELKLLGKGVQHPRLLGNLEKWTNPKTKEVIDIIVFRTFSTK